MLRSVPAAAVLLLALFAPGCAPDTPLPTAPILPRPTASLVAVASANANEAAALSISDNIQRWHVPYGTITDPIFADSTPSSPEYLTLSALGYDRSADAALWTRHYLAAESFRYAAGPSAAGLVSVRRAVDAVRRLVDVNELDGDPNVLARCARPGGDRYADAIMAGEAKHGDCTRIAYDAEYRWLGNTT